ncbi:D-alanyl-D-alanine carboxypeptidase [Candidatus Daviesbacteria bacterium]|nr:D-alanyl-D-alanine carboxypeptidase [Candidatus Daviesbacteria bacterium]
MVKRFFRTFLITLCLTFLMVVISHFHIKTGLISPQLKTQDILEKIQPKLERKQNNFYLKKQFIQNVSAGSEYDQAVSYAVVDYDSGQILLSKNLSGRLPMASLTKVMTAVVALDLAKPDEQFTVSDKAALQIPTKVMLKAGEKFSLENLLQQMLISSANDSAETLKEGIDAKFNQAIFIKAMNLKAQIIGLKDTHFTNAEGFDSRNHYSSVEDLSVLAVYALKQYPLIAQTVSRQFADLTEGGADNRFYLNNWNGLLGVYPGAFGVKIGNTQKAGNCTIVASERGDKKIVAVILGAPGVLERDLWASELLDLGFSKLANLPAVGVTEDQLKAKYASWKYYQ